ncbi:MAG: glycine--tRNA ligase subunit beta, partial [Rickettsiaceae bacterium]|nr:glycine--tRNA ligase subunit beta [Rickettsiaceae bacterium]
MSELLLELFSEEIPAMMQQKAVAGYEEIFAKYFQEQTINFSSIKAYAGPRRITIHVSGISSYVEATTKEIKGPKISAPDNAIEGFCHSNGISKDLLTHQEIKGVEYFVYEQILAKQETKNILQNTLMNPISAYVWPKSMFWGDYQIKWVRPLRNIMCIFNGQTLDFKYGHLVANNKSFGHRFMSPKSFEVTSFAEYKQKLSNNFVVLDQSERKDYIS